MPGQLVREAIASQDCYDTIIDNAWHGEDLVNLLVSLIFGVDKNHAFQAHGHIKGQMNGKIGWWVG